jgi:hypothetical protein
VKGAVVYLYAFDVADEILTSKVQEILAKQPFTFEVPMERAVPRDLPLYRPLAIETGPVAAFGGRPVCALVRVYEVGVVTVALRIEVEANNLSDLVPFHSPPLDSGEALDDVARDLCGRVCESLSDLMLRGAPPSSPEAYTVLCLTDIEGVRDTSAWLAEQRRDVAALLAQASPDEVSEAQIAEALRIQRSFGTRDLVVIDWDAALVVDLSGYLDDVLYVLELANLQLEEFRVMDARLDRYVNKAYEDLERRGAGRFAADLRTLRSLRRFRVDATKLAEEVTHITKFLGDWYLARVYLGARERFHLDEWRGSVERKLGHLDQIYGMVHSQAYEQRMFWLEVMIVVMFAVDLLSLLFK